eukprot:5952991-Prymnesium_polylepis.2
MPTASTIEPTIAAATPIQKEPTSLVLCEPLLEELLHAASGGSELLLSIGRNSTREPCGKAAAPAGSPVSE